MMKIGSGSPLGKVTPSAAGDEYYDFTNHQRWIASGANGAAWELDAAQAAVNPSSYSLVSGVALTVLTVPLAVGAMAAGALDFAVKVTDGTDFQVVKCKMDFTAANKAGVATIDKSPLTVTPFANTNGAATIDVEVAFSLSSGQLIAQLTVTTSLAATSLTATVSSRTF